VLYCHKYRFQRERTSGTPESRTWGWGGKEERKMVKRKKLHKRGKEMEKGKAEDEIREGRIRRKDNWKQKPKRRGKKKEKEDLIMVSATDQKAGWGNW
jgi:hypothetical protein